MDLMGLAGNLFNMGMTEQNGFQQWAQALGQGAASGNVPNPGQYMANTNLLQMLQQQNPGTNIQGLPGVQALDGGGGAIQGVPPMPPQQDIMDFQQMQQSHQEIEKQARGDLEQNVADEKDAFFETHHWGTDKDGHRVLKGDRGETAAERLDRRNADRAARQTLVQQQQDAKQAFYANVQAQIQAANNPNDPNNQANLQHLQDQFSAQEKQMLNNQERAVLNVGVPPGTSVQGAVDRGLGSYTALQAQHQRDEQNSPQYQRIQAFQQATAAYVAMQRQQMTPGNGMQDQLALMRQARGGGFA